MFTIFPTRQEKRMLLIFADSVDNAQLIRQQQILNADVTGLKERDIDVHIYYADKNADRFRIHKIKTKFTVVLIGKDGGEKLRSTQPFTVKKLYATIDAMPMRQQEMKHQPKTE
ncbi:DUF4174 domain-containing protein [Mucilaginibacter lacusdianchii]|uniref:DUF4174 domain-containing protein n=1 Tax=Mucilaginibacter lacusdianchii TaxID=2684211 RepID=UPI00131AE539|nr:DUF4174 domain-containing protein [Mucilaginibacter sp. JXJ CY 39]